MIRPRRSPIVSHGRTSASGGDAGGVRSRGVGFNGGEVKRMVALPKA